MGKSKKRKKKIKSIMKGCSKFIELLSSGEILFKKDAKLDISDKVNASIENAIISRLDAIPTKENVVIDTSELEKSGLSYRIDVTTDNSSVMRAVDIQGAIDSDNELTIVIPMTKKKARKFEGNDTLYWLSKTSSLDSVMQDGCYSSWSNLNKEDTSQYTNVLYIPKLCMFLDKNGRLRSKLINVNLLIVAVPSIKDAVEGIETIDDVEYTNRIVNDSIEAAIKVGAKNIVLDPYVMPALQKDVHYTAKYWKCITEQQRTIENIKSIKFTIDNDNLFIIFSKN